MEENTTVDRLVRMLDEERNDRIATAKEMFTSVKEMLRLREELTKAEGSWREARNQNWELLEKNRELMANTHTNSFVEAENERFRTALIRFANEHRGEFEQPVVDIIPVIKAVRERFGLGLKESKAIVDQWRLDDDNRANAEEIIAREDPGTFDEEEYSNHTDTLENINRAEETDWTGTADYNDMVRKGLREDA